jgi:(2Fe-2S) ferredoxin
MPEGDWYCRIQQSDVETIVKEHLEGDRPVRTLLHPRFHPRDEESDEK